MTCECSALSHRFIRSSTGVSETEVMLCSYQSLFPIITHLADLQCVGGIKHDSLWSCHIKARLLFRKVNPTIIKFTWVTCMKHYHPLSNKSIAWLLKNMFPVAAVCCCKACLLYQKKKEHCLCYFICSSFALETYLHPAKQIFFFSSISQSNLEFAGSFMYDLLSQLQ